MTASRPRQRRGRWISWILAAALEGALVGFADQPVFSVSFLCGALLLVFNVLAFFSSTAFLWIVGWFSYGPSPLQRIEATYALAQANEVLLQALKFEIKQNQLLLDVWQEKDGL